MNLLVAFIYLVVCAYGAARITRRILSGETEQAATASTLIWILLFFALFQGGFHVLGLLDLPGQRQLVEPLNALAVVAFVLVLFEWFARKFSVNSGARGPTPHVLAGIGLLGRLVRSHPILAASAATLLCAAVLQLFQFPQGFEAQAYHVPVGLYIFQSKSLGYWDKAFENTLNASASLYFGFLLQILPERVAGCANAVFAIPLALATYGTARGLKADQPMSALVVAGLFTIPLVAIGLFELNADIGGIAFLAVAVYLAVARPVSRVPAVVLAGMAAGLAFGFKLFHIVSVGYLFVVIACGYFGKRSDDASTVRKPDLSGALLFALGAILTGGFWLARSYWMFHNPFYPVHLPVISDMLNWPAAVDTIDTSSPRQLQWVRSSLEWFVYPWIEWHDIGQNFKHSSGLGAFYAATSPVAYLLVLAKLLFGTGTGKRSLAMLWIGATLVFALWWATVREPRYFMGAFVYLAPLAAWTFSHCSGPSRKVFNAIAMTCIGVMLFIVLSKDLVAFGDHVIFSKQFTRAQYYEYPEIIDRLPAQSTIGAIGMRTSHYSLFGAGFRNKVVSNPEVMRVLQFPSAPLAPNVNGGYVTPVGGYDIPPLVELSYSTIKQLRITHLYVVGKTELRSDPCVGLEEIGILDRNPLSNKPLPEPRRVLKITLCPEGPKGGPQQTSH